MICPRVHSRSVAAVGFESGSGAPSPDCTAPMVLRLTAAHGTVDLATCGPELGWGNPFPLAFFTLISQPLPGSGSIFEGRPGGHTSRFPGFQD